HEYGHAIVHLGVNARNANASLSRFGSGDKTDWVEFGEQRLTAFEDLPKEAHELLAQTITHACLTQLPDKSWSSRLQAAFDILESKQDPSYQVPADTKLQSQLINWPLVFDGARGDSDVHRGPTFSWRDGL